MTAVLILWASFLIYFYQKIICTAKRFTQIEIGLLFGLQFWCSLTVCSFMFYSQLSIGFYFVSCCSKYWSISAPIHSCWRLWVLSFGYSPNNALVRSLNQFTFYLHAHSTDPNFDRHCQSLIHFSTSFTRSSIPTRHLRCLIKEFVATAQKSLNLSW